MTTTTLTTRLARDIDTGQEFLVTTYDDGSQWVATRPDSWSTWSPEVELAPVTTTTRTSTWVGQHEAAEYLGVSERTIRNYIARGDLPGHRVKGSRLVRIRRADLDALLRPIPTGHAHA